MGRIGATFASTEDAESAITILRERLRLPDSWVMRARLGAAGTEHHGLPLVGARVPRALEAQAVELLREAGGTIVEVPAFDQGDG